MGNEIEVGEYIRTDKGNVGKLIEIRLGENIQTKKFQNIYKLDTGLWTVRQYIVNHSDNPRDLIEVGDMVHTKDVLNEDWYWMFDKEMVKATKETIEKGVDLIEIVTKEMMESISYKVTKM